MKQFVFLLVMFFSVQVKAQTLFLPDAIGTSTSTGNVGIGINNPQERLHIAGNLLLQNIQGSPSSNLYMYSSDGLMNTRIDYNGIVTQGSGLTIRATTKLVLNDLGGNVGIGTTNPQNLLDVNGTIHAKEIKVDLNGWSDFVFKADYKLIPLFELEQFIKQQGHLPEIPTESDVKQNSLSLGDIQSKLLQKIEELTLYTIEQQKQIDELKKQIRELKK